MTLLESGDHVVVTDNTYGGTYRCSSVCFESISSILRMWIRQTGSDCRRDRAEDEDAVLETPTNPTLRLTDLAAACEVAHKRHVVVAVDNTFASPYIQRPIEFGADLVIHSTTKFLNGHSDSVGGVVVATRDDHIEWLRFIQNAEGAILGTDGRLARATRHQDAADPHGAAQRERDALAEFPRGASQGHAGALSRVAFASAARACKKQMRGFGGLIAFTLGSLDNARTLLNHVQLIALAESLGGVESLISHPATMTHASVPADRRQQIGITDDLVRISVGIEDVDDLQEDLQQALARIS
jgi:cystathionine gamma-lyase/cystathionine beta-lyase/cystathionine gamma-lyase/homocysteine desulfhydrase